MVGACGVRGGAREELGSLERFAGREIEMVRFVEPGPFTEDTLSQIVETQPSRCSFLGLPICVPLTDIGREVHRLDLEALRRDVQRLETFYRSSGYYGTAVVPVVEPEPGDEEDVVVSFVITPGDPVYLESFVLVGTEPVVEPAVLLSRLPLRVGELFDLGDFTASADTVRRVLLAEGHAYAQVLRNFDVDTLTDRASASILAVPGPVVVVDSIVVVGAENVGRRAVLRQLTFREGDLLRVDELPESQSNLYALEIVDFATVEVAPDSLQRSPGDSSTATVLVRVAEGPVHVVEAAVGYGTVDCFRTRVQWISRNFGGGARRLALTAEVSKIGIGDPLDAGFGGSICRAFEGDPFGDVLDYRFSADLMQPYFLGPRNNVALNIYAERESEPRVFQREAEGARLTVLRRLGRREALSASLDVERRRTLATAAVFCVAFLVCRPEDIEELTDDRLTNTVGLSWFRNRTDVLLDPTRGYVVRAAADWTTARLGADADYGRSTGDFAAYASPRRDWVLAGSVRAGTFIGGGTIEPGDDFVPPEDRYYAGGASSVRGYARNELGPGVYVEEGPQFDPDEVEFIPTGGLSVAVVSLELRLPLPVQRGDLRLALFVDAGAVDEDRLWEQDIEDWRVTPGVGVRVATPVGPVRLDIAYNPYSPRVAPLYLIEPETGVLVRVADAFAPERESFWSRFRVNLAIGQPF